MGEELRILYVAMTRAKEKLIITARDKYLENKIEKWGMTGWRRTAVYRAERGVFLSGLDLDGSKRGAKRTIDVKNVPMKDLLVEEEKNQEEKAKLYLELEQLGKSRKNSGTDSETVSV